MQRLLINTRQQKSGIAEVKVTNMKPVLCAKLNTGIPEGFLVMAYLYEEK